MYIQTSIPFVFTSFHTLMDHSGFPVFEWKTVEVMKGVFVIRLCEIPEKHRYGISVLVFGMVWQHNKLSMLSKFPPYSLVSATKKANSCEVYVIPRTNVQYFTSYKAVFDDAIISAS